MPVDPHLLLAYLAACAVLILTPGPDMLFVIAQTLRGGAARGWAAALGIFVGTFGHVALAAIGLAAVLAASPGLFLAVRVAGAAYLIWLGVNCLRAALRTDGGAAAPDTAVGGAPLGRGAAFRQGMATNLLNPKVALFFLAFLPQFVAPDRAPAWLQMLLLGPLLPLFALPFFGALIAAAGRAASALARVRRWLDAAAGAVFVGLGVRVLLAPR
ncbi:LysE family translocator [Craurococcus roseus]|uniref:LysE family translocator n=1 Tax=Craurococcus roseus TaxID=77585 RepID=A0ABP3Q9Y0_9PROT